MLRILPFSITTGADNMAADWNMMEQLSKIVATTEAPYPILFRLYCWQPSCISLGYNQPEPEFLRKRAEEYGIDIVRRPTGGRAVLHADELTYCIVAHASSFSAKALYAHVHNTLIRVLSTTIPAMSTSQGQSLFEHYRASSIEGNFCFASRAESEIVVGQKKLVGSAQRTYGAITLQHGSIPFGNSNKIFSELFVRETSHAQRLRTTLDARSTSVSEHSQVTMDELINHLAIGFQTHF
jgi:lipoate-protein ligase A